MARKVEAVLTWLTHGSLSDPTPASREFGAHVAAMLRARFDRMDLNLVEHAEQAATRASVLASLRRAVANLQASPDGLLVLAFSGHGDELAAERHAWVLQDARLAEDTLRKELEGLPAGVEVVLVADCCYASKTLPVRSGLPGVLLRLLVRLWPGMVVPDPKALARLRRLRESMVQRLSQPASDNVPARNVICIASTNSALVRENTQDNTFSRCLRKAVVPSPPAEYALVDDTMEKILKEMKANGPVAWIQEDWQVVYQPAGAGELVPFRQ